MTNHLATRIMITAFHRSASAPKLGSKLLCIRLNRVLAWSLIVSPPLQWAGGMSFWTGFWIDIAILVVHGVMSLALFGKPNDKRRSFEFGLHVMGLRAGYEMSERNRFLLSGYRIALAAVAIVLMFWLPGSFAFIAGLLFFYPVLRMPITLIQHMFTAFEYAFKRWGVPAKLIDVLPAALVMMYLIVSFINLVR